MSRRAQAAPAVLASALLAKVAPEAQLDAVLAFAEGHALVLRPKVRVRPLPADQCSASFRWTQHGGLLAQTVTVRFSRVLLDGVPRV